MNWLPPAMEWSPLPHDDFRPAVRSARAIDDADVRIERLWKPANCRLGYLELLQLDDAWRAGLDTPAATSLPAVRIAVLSSSTVDHLASALRVAGLRRRMRVDVYTGMFGQLRQELHDPDSPLHRFRPDDALFALSSRTMTAGIGLDADAASVAGTLPGRLPTSASSGEGCRAVACDRHAAVVRRYRGAALRWL